MAWFRWLKPKWMLQNLLPPALLTYFARTWYICVTEIGPQYVAKDLNKPILGHLYSTFATVSIFTISTLYLRLYFLPSSQSVPPPTPPTDLDRGIYECLPLPAPSFNGGAEMCKLQRVLVRCERPSCKGRWKPPRTRHCSDCGTCRMGFDHHCAFSGEQFANCLTAPYIPTFLLTTLYTAPTVLVLSAPLLPSLARRAIQAYVISRSDSSIVEEWYGWTWSWFIAGGPVGRYVGGIILGWRLLDQKEGRGHLRLEIGIITAIGLVLALMTLGLAASMIDTIRNGSLTVDRERAKSFARLKSDIDRLIATGIPVPAKMTENMNKLTAQTFFWIPIPIEEASEGSERSEGDRRLGVVIPTLPGEQPYDLGPSQNWQVYMGEGWNWLVPWSVFARSKQLNQTIHRWPLNPAVEARLKLEAGARIKDVDLGSDMHAI